MNKETCNICHVCGNSDYLSKSAMAKEILEKIGYPRDEASFVYGSFSTPELRAIWRYVCRGGK